MHGFYGGNSIHRVLSVRSKSFGQHAHPEFLIARITLMSVGGTKSHSGFIHISISVRFMT